MKQLSVNALLAVIVLAAFGCGGGGYAAGTTKRIDQNDVVYYPKPEVSSSAASMAKLQVSAVALGCTAMVMNGQLPVNCTEAGGDIVFGANSSNASVLQAGCLKGVSEQVCEEFVKKIIAGQK
jgi:hypothetical protein